MGGPDNLRGAVLCALTVVLLGATAGCHNGQVRMRLAPGSHKYVWQAPITATQCRQFYEDLTYEVKPAVGYGPGRGEEMERFSVDARLRWNDAVHPLSGLFEGLCHDHNRALISLNEFEKRKSQLTVAASALAGLKKKLNAAMDDYGKARELETANRGAVGQKAKAAIFRAHQQMAAVSRQVDEIIKKATALVNALRGKRAGGNVMAALPPQPAAPRSGTGL
jgi:hypothetical protein